MTVFIVQGFSKPIYANIKFVDNQTESVVRKEQLDEPFRLIVTKSDVLVHYNLRLIGVELIIQNFCALA